MDQSAQPERVDASDASSAHDSGDEFSESNEDDYRTILEARVALWNVQLKHEILTPLLEKEMESAIGVMTKSMQKPQFSADADLVERLESLHNDITEHWGKVFKSPGDRSLLVVNVKHFEVFFAGMLYEDYMLQPVNPWEHHLPGNHWFSNSSSSVQHHREPKDDSSSNNDEYYQENILLPLKEMNLGCLVSHAENRLCTAAVARRAGAKGTGAYVSRLIQGCEWEGLAETLIHDRQLFNILCSHRPIHVNRKWLETVRPKILQQMDDLQHTYYTNMSSPTNYTISKHAMDLLARHSVGGQHRVPLSQIPKSRIHTSPISKIKGRLQLLADGLNLKFHKDATTSSAYSEEKSHLLFQPQKSTATSSIISDEKGSLLK